MSRFLQELEQECKRQHANVFAIAEYHDGKITSRQLLDINPCQDIYSVAKVYVVTAIGLLTDQGLLRLDEIVTDILAEECPADFVPIWKRTTVEMLLLHKVGVPRNFLDIDTFDAASFGEDYLTYIMKEPILGPTAGKEPCYTDAAYYLLARIAEKRAGMSLDNFLWKYLFYPTGCREAAWSHCPKGHVIGATGLYLRVEELVKLGSIYLNGGIWKDKRILSQEWVDTVFTQGYELKPLAGGLAYGKGGMRGQMLMILPGQKRVVAYLGCGTHSLVEFVNVAGLYDL